MLFGRAKETFRFEKKDACAVLTRYSGRQESVCMPDEYEGLPVAEIGDNAFYDCAHMQTLTLPQSLKRIGTGAFRGCAALICVNVPDAVREIGDYAFASCKSLEEIRLPAGLPKISAGTFEKCRALTRIKLPDTVTEVGDGAFAQCASLCAADMGSGVKQIAENAFKGAGAQLKLILPEGYEGAVPEGFDMLYKRVESGLCLAAYAGHEVRLALDDAVDGEDVTEIGPRVFAMFAYLESVRLPARLVRIDELAFAGCSGIEELTFPESLKFIDRGAFSGCGQSEGRPSYARVRRGDMTSASGLKAIRLPAGLESVGEGAFSGCYALEEAAFRGRGYVYRAERVFGLRA